MLAEHDRRLSFCEQGLEPSLPLDERQVPPVLPVFGQKVKRDEPQVLVLPLRERLLEELELAVRGLVEDDHFPVDQRMNAELGEGVRYRAELGRPILPASRVDPDFLESDGDESAIAVILDLVDPFRAIRGPVLEKGELRCDEGGHIDLAANPAAAVRDPLPRAARNLIHPASSRDAVLPLLSRVEVRSSGVVLLLDQQPILALVTPSRRHPDEGEAALETLAGKREAELALPQTLVGIALRRPRAPVPQHDGPAAVLAFRDGAPEAP